MKIDVFSHILPVKYKEAIEKAAPPGFYHQEITDSIPTLFQLENRFRIMDKFEDMIQVLTLTQPPVEEIFDPKKAADMAKMANDEMAELVMKYPDRFAAAVACLPMNNMEAALKEVDRAVNDLKFRGVQIFTPINDKPLDSPEFMPLYEKMSQYNLPIWIHPMRNGNRPDYKGEEKSKYNIFIVVGWPYETAMTMIRLVFSGVLEKYSNLKFITHHCGSMIPFFEQRIENIYDSFEMRQGDKSTQGLTKKPLEYFRMFYNDTAVNGSTPALMCGHAFFGADHLLFGSDMPFDSQLGGRFIRQTIESIDRMDISDVEKKMIYEDNARKLMRLPV